MSTGNLLALALGLGGGALAWHLTRDATHTHTPTPATPAVSAPPRNDAPCSLKLDRSGLTADGGAADVPAAVTRCKARGRADLIVASSAPAGAFARLTAALQAAGVPFTQKVA